MCEVRRFRTLAEVRRRGQVPRIADLRRGEHIVRDDRIGGSHHRFCFDYCRAMAMRMASSGETR